MILIGLAAKAGAGKDTIADHLVEKHGFVKYSFAKPLKDMLRAIGVDADTRETKELPHPRFGKSPRYMAQTLGTEWGRDLICDNIWLLCAAGYLDQVNAWIRRDGEKDIPKAPVGVVIADTRFENEAAFIRRHEGQIWHIRRSVPEVNAHVSEAGVKFEADDGIVSNTGSIERLHTVVDEGIRMLSAGDRMVTS